MGVVSSGLVVAGIALTFGCGQHPHAEGDAAVDMDAGVDSADGSGADAGADAPSGTLSPEPVDPTNPPCSGVLGFPNLPAVRVSNGYELQVVDVNGDGIKDVVVDGSQEIRIARGVGNGTFLPATSIAMPFNARVFRLADLNGDSKPDLVFRVAMGAVDEIRRAFNDGNGGFGSPQTIASITGGIRQIELVDLNSDGQKDLLAFNGGLAVLINSGSGFGAPQFYTVATQYSDRMAVGDVSEDGKPDVVAGNGSAISVLINSGTGTFAPYVTYATVSVAWGIVLVDANEDGRLDAVVSGEQSLQQDINVLLNQGSGVFGAATSYPLGPGYAQREIVSADINGDGHADIGAVGGANMAAKLVFGTGTGQFGTAVEIVNDVPSAIVFADLQGDGRPEMVLRSYDLVTAYVNRGGAMPFETRLPISFAVQTLTDRGARMTDLNGDGRLDLIRMGDDIGEPGTTSVRLATSTSSFGPTTTYTTLAAIFHTALADLNNDNRADIVLFGYGAQTLLNNGDGTLSAMTALSFGYWGRELAIADLDNNGLRDLLVAHGDVNDPTANHTISLYSGFGNGQFGAGTLIWSGATPFGLVTPDLNGDGKRDIVITSYLSGFRLEVLLATGNGSFAGPVVTTTTFRSSRLYARDFNNDGNQDVLGFDSFDTIVTLGSGTGTFAAPLHSPGQADYGFDAAFGDFDGDGKLDVVTVASGVMCLLRGHGDGMFDAPTCYPSGRGRDITLGDIDGDGRIDILVDNVRDQVSVLYGRCISN